MSLLYFLLAVVPIFIFFIPTIVRRIAKIFEHKEADLAVGKIQITSETQVVDTEHATHTLQLSKDYLLIDKALFALDDIVGVHCTGTTLSIHIFATTEKSTNTRTLINRTFVLENEQTANKWRQLLFAAASLVQDTCNKLLVFVNPVSGTKKAKEMWKKLAPVFSVANNVAVHVVETTHHGHAAQVVEKFDFTDYFGIVVVSGDGLLFEIVNTLMARADCKALIERLTLGVIPMGSGNGLAYSINLLPDLEGIALKIIKRKKRALDLLSIKRGKKFIYSFLSVSYGFIADVDFGSEKLRWLGDTRFDIYGTWLWIFLRSYPTRLKIHHVKKEKQACVGKACETCSAIDAPERKQALEEFFDYVSGNETPLPSDTYDTLNIDEQMVWMVASNISKIGGATVTGPFSHCADGLMDLTLIRLSRMERMRFALFLMSLDSGKLHEYRMLEYLKCKQVEIESLDVTTEDKPGESYGRLDIDGEMFSAKTKIIVRAHQGVLSIFA